jgi:hypothetical protein
MGIRSASRSLTGRKMQHRRLVEISVPSVLLRIRKD